MDDISYIFNSIKNSRITLIGYTYQLENTKDELISKIPILKLGEISSSFCILSHLRDIKINNLLSDVSELYNHLHLDITDVKILSDNTGKLMSRPKVISRIISEIHEYITPLNINLIITAPLYRGFNSVENIFMGGNSPLYKSDFVFKIEEDSIKIIKDRNSLHNIDEISFDSLKDYNYICNYETSNK